MKRKLLFSILFLSVTICHAQTFDEWFKQKKTQIKYLIQQIAALETYTSYLEKGYNIAKNGLNTINDIKHGEFNIHSGYFNSLQTVNPAIKNWGEVATIISNQVSIVAQFRKLVTICKASSNYTSAEIAYINRVYDNMASECVKDIDELTDLLSSGSLQLTDDERMTRIEKLNTDMQGKFDFTRSFSNNAIVLGAQRTGDLSDVNVLQNLYKAN